MFDHAIKSQQGSDQDKEERKRFKKKIVQVSKLYPETLSQRFDPLAFKHRFESTYPLKIIFKVIERLSREASNIQGDIWSYAIQALQDEASKELGIEQDSTEVTPKEAIEVPPKKVIEMPIREPFAENDNLKEDTQKSEDDDTQHEPISGGHFLVARKIYKSKIWLKHPFYLKVWLWILGRASYVDHEKDGRKYKRGELITTYDEIIKDVAYYFNNQHIVPTLKQIRLILQWLKQEGMIIVEPLRSNDPRLFLTRADPGADLKDRARAYLGIRIIVVNYDTYQDRKRYTRADLKTGTRTEGFSLLGHDYNKGIRMGKEIDAQNFLSFWKEYPHKVAKKKAHEAWNKLEKAEDMKTLLPTLLDAIKRQKQAKETAKAKGEFSAEWPYPATWLNGRRWEDEVEVKKRWDHAAG